MALLIIISLGTLIILACITVLTKQGSFSDVSSSSFLENGTQSNWTVYSTSSGFYIDEFEGAIIILVIIVAIVAVIGLRIFNSGLSDSGIRTITIIIFYASLWGIFSVMAYDLIISIAIFGSFIYVILTIIFIMGVFQTIHN